MMSVPKSRSRAIFGKTPHTSILMYRSGTRKMLSLVVLRAVQETMPLTHLVMRDAPRPAVKETTHRTGLGERTVRRALNVLRDRDPAFVERLTVAWRRKLYTVDEAGEGS